MKNAMKTALCGAGLVLLLAGVPVRAAVDGETYRVAGGEEWVQTGNYSGLTMGIWKDGAVPSDGGTARLVTAGTIKLYPASGLQLGAIEVSSGVNATLTSRGLTMTGANPYIQVANNGTLVCESSTPVSGTGANTLLLKTAPGYGVGRIDLYAGASNFGLLDIESGAVNGYCTGVNQTMLTTGPVWLSGGYLSYVAKMASAGSASASIATGAGSTFTISPGPARLRVALRTNANDATLTLGPIVRDGRAYAEIDCSNESENGQTLGTRTFVKTTQAPTLVNGFVEPWLVAKGEGANTLHDIDFLTYSADTGFFPATNLYATSFGNATDVVNVNGNFSIDTETQVLGLRMVNTEDEPSITLNADLKVGDGTHPAAVILNYASPRGDKRLSVTGTGAIDFGTSEGIIWLGVQHSDARRYLNIGVPVKGSNGITFAAPYQTTGRAPIINPQNDSLPAWTGPLHLRNVRYVASSQNKLPTPDVYLDGRGATRGAQVLISTTLTNHFHISGNGLQDSTDKSGALNSNGTLEGPVTLEHDATLFSYGTFTLNGVIDGTGALTLQSEGNSFALNAANTYDGPTSLINAMVTLGANGSLSTGPVSVDADSVLRTEGCTKTVPNAISGSGKVQLAAATVSATGANDFDTLAFDGNSAASMAGASTFTATDTTAAAVTGLGTVNGTALTVKSDSASELHATLAGSARFVKDGAGTLAVFSDVASSGGITVKDGTLKTVARLDAPFTDSLVFHLDATRADTFKYAADGTVTNWASTVGKVFFKVPSGVFSGPTREATGWNDLSVVKFTAAVSNRLVSSTTIAPRTLFFVVRPRPENMISCAALFGQSGKDDNGVRAVTHLAGGTWTWDSGAGTGSHHVFDSDGRFIIDGGKAGYREISNNTPQVIVVEKSDANTLRALSFSAGLGGHTSMDNRNLDGDVAEVVAYDRILTESERKRVENYLGRKWKEGAFYDDVENLSLGSGALTLTDNGVLDLAGSDVTVASLAGTGLITNSSDRAATLTVTGSSTFSGEVRGNVALSVAGGTLTAALSDDASLGVTGNSTLGVYNYQPPAEGLVWWMDASDASTITTNASGQVTGWTSKGGAAVSFAPDGNLPKPVYAPVGHANAMGGKPAIWFDGEDRTRLVGSASKSVKTTFLVWNATTAGVAKGTAAGVYGFKNVDAGIRYWTNLGIQYCYSCSPFSDVDACYVDGNKLPISAYGTSGSAPVPADVVHVLSAVAGAGRAAPEKTYVFGSYVGNLSRCFIGWICEAIAYDRCLSESERKQVENYLIAKWKGAGAIAANTAVGGDLTVASGATLTAAAGQSLDVGTLSGAGAISGNVSVDGFEVTVKPNGTVDKLTVNGTVTFNAGAHLQVNDFNYLVNGNYETFLDATDNVGTFATSNLEKPYGWTLRNGHGQVYQANGFMLIFR